MDKISIRKFLPKTLRNSQIKQTKNETIETLYFPSLEISLVQLENKTKKNHNSIKNIVHKLYILDV